MKEGHMLRPFIVLPMLTTLVVMSPTLAHADPYKWCAQYGSGKGGGGGRNCGFVSYEQCMQTSRGMGGFCEPNQFYTGPDEKPAKRGRKRHYD